MWNAIEEKTWEQKSNADSYETMLESLEQAHQIGARGLSKFYSINSMPSGGVKAKKGLRGGVYYFFL